MSQSFKIDGKSPKKTTVNQKSIAFIKLEEIFNEEIGAWLEGLFARAQYSEVKTMYESQDGRWIFLFARKLENTVYCILAEREDRGNFLREFCMGWLNVVEHSPFVAQMSGEQTEEYSADIEGSIETCEDFLDALNVPDKEGKAVESINSFDPGFYQFRVEKRFRFLACAFSLDYSGLETNIQALLEKLRLMGEGKCCGGSVAVALTYILKLYVNKAGHELESVLSFDSNGTIAIKNCALALCYLTRIMFRCGDGDVASYTSRLYQLLSLWNIFSEKDKLKLLGNAYASLFINKCPFEKYKWEEFETMVMNKSYLFETESVPFDKNKRLVYNDSNTEVSMTSAGFSLAPRNSSPNGMVPVRLLGGITADLFYDKSLTGLLQEPDFSKVQSVWGMVDKSVFAPAKVVKKVKEEKKMPADGEDIDIYVTEIIDENRIMCRAVDYDIEGQTVFNDFFFYPKPKVVMEDFLGDDGSPMLFPAIYHDNGERVSFRLQELKVDFARHTMPGGIITCCVISKDGQGRVAVSEGGLFLNFRTEDESVEPMCFVKLFVTGTRPTGHAEAEFCGFSETDFDNSKVYRNYLRDMNDYFYNGPWTLADDEERRKEPEDVEEETEAMVSPTYVWTLAGLIFKVSRTERNLRQRYGRLCISRMLSRLIGDEAEGNLYSVRMRYTRMLYDFSVNNKLLDMDVEAFVDEFSGMGDVLEVREKANVVRILGRYGKTVRKNGLDETLSGILAAPESTPLERELARLVLMGNMLTDFKNRAIEDQILSEIGNRLNTTIERRDPVSIGLEEGQNVEFKTSIVYPPTGDGVEDIENQSDNIAREISAFMNATGGKLYIGVNDFGNVVGMQSDLEYFSGETEGKSKDKFMNYFSNLLARKFGPVDASAIKCDFEDREGYTIFVVDIPSMPGHGGDYIRVGTVCRRKYS